MHFMWPQSFLNLSMNFCLTMRINPSEFKMELLHVVHNACTSILFNLSVSAQELGEEDRCPLPVGNGYVPSLTLCNLHPVVSHY